MIDLSSPDVVITPSRKRGIQPGQVARAGAPTDLEVCLASACDLAFANAQPQLLERLSAGCRVVRRAGFRDHEVLERLANRGFEIPAEGLDMAGYYPDGGIFSLHLPDGRIIPYLAAEAKHQGPTGNAIERWHKNYNLTKLLGWDVGLLTFATGEGSQPGGPIRKALNVALAEYALSRQKPVRSWDQLYLMGPSMFSSLESFDMQAMVDILESAIVEGAVLCARS